MKSKEHVLKKYIIGISAFYHDSSVSIIDTDGNILFASLEERFSRKKHDNSFPEKALLYGLNSIGIDFTLVEKIVFYEKPFLRFFLSLRAVAIFYPYSYLYFFNYVKKFFFHYFYLQRFLKKYRFSGELLFLDHHLSHAALSYYLSGYKEAGVLVIDGVGDNSTISFYLGNKESLELKEEIGFPHSIGLLYSLFTAFLGFEPNDGEYKIMGLASYGTPKYTDLIKSMCVKDTEGEFILDTQYFNFTSFTSPYTKKFIEIFGNPRKKEEPITQYHQDIAASIQAYLEFFLITYLEWLQVKYLFKNLCISGGVAFNCKFNGELFLTGKFEKLYIPSNPGDGGSSLGAALYVVRDKIFGRKDIEVQSANTGLDIDVLQEDYLEGCLKKYKYEMYKIQDIQVFETLVNMLSQDKVIAVIQGKAEFGPRALCHRSILASPSNPKIKDILNIIKGRELFRPFAPIVLASNFCKYFSGNSDSPYMLFLHTVISKDIPGVTHIDGTARTQVIQPGSNLFIENLLHIWEQKTGFGVLINTSFNIAGEVMVNTLEESLDIFGKTGIHALVIRHNSTLYLLSK